MKFSPVSEIEDPGQWADIVKEASAVTIL